MSGNPEGGGSSAADADTEPVSLLKAAERYRGKRILAPMVKIGTLPTRLLALEFGADLVYSEEIIDFRLIRCERIENTAIGTVDYIDRSDDTLVLRVSPRERGRLVLQIGTCDPKRAAKVAKMVERDVDGIDVNMGCPKSFSLKGGMGAALLTQPEKVRRILTSLVEAVEIPITCKIRLLPTMEETLNLVKIIESTGVSALAVHGRTKEERPNHSNNVDAITQVVRSCSLPVIANGGSSNNRNSPDNTYEGIEAFWRESEASSVMIARAAEWNPSVFRKEGKLPIMEVVHKYLDLAIEFDYTFVIVKYNIQQILGGEQDSEIGRKFLAAATMKDLVEIFGKGPVWEKRQAHIREKTRQDALRPPTFRFQREAVVTPKKRKICPTGDDDHNGESVIVTEMFCPFVRGHYTDGRDIPKVRLLQWTKDQGLEQPAYQTTQIKKTFRSIVTVAGQKFSSESWEKNKKYSEQAAAIVALHCLGSGLIHQDGEDIACTSRNVPEKC